MTLEQIKQNTWKDVKELGFICSELALGAATFVGASYTLEQVILPYVEAIYFLGK